MTNPDDFVVAQVKDSDGMWCQPKGGLTKREYFAGMAMQGLRAAHMQEYCRGATVDKQIWNSERLARQSVADADALLVALSRTEEKSDV